jgi:hypothetical protein
MLSCRIAEVVVHGPESGAFTMWRSLGLRGTQVAVKANASIRGMRAKMAGNGETNGDLNAHTDSYARFIWWLKFGSIATALITALVIFLITR